MPCIYLLCTQPLVGRVLLRTIFLPAVVCDGNTWLGAMRHAAGYHLQTYNFNHNLLLPHHYVAILLIIHLPLLVELEGWGHVLLTCACILVMS